MPIIKFTAADVLRNTVLPAGWYGAKIVKVGDWKASKNGDSQNMVITFRIEKADGKEIDINYNSKMINMILPLVAATENKEIKPEDFMLNTDDLLGKEVDVNVIHSEYDGRIKNDIDKYAPFGRGSQQAAY